MTASWFEKLMDFPESSYQKTKKNLEVVGETLRSGRLRVSTVVGDVGRLYRESATKNALFQVASQFNLLEMAGPDVTPEGGVTRYIYDRTQGPACALGDVTLWVASEAVAGWTPCRSGRRGGQRRYSDLAIETAMTLRLLCHLSLRQAEEFLHALFGMMYLDLSAPDDTTLSRRSALPHSPPATDPRCLVNAVGCQTGSSMFNPTSLLWVRSFERVRSWR